MSNADQIAIKVKHALFEFDRIGLHVRKICFGMKQMAEIKSNPYPREDADYKGGGLETFCGVECFEIYSAYDLVAYEFSNI